MTTDTTQKHAVERIKRESKRRIVSVARSFRLTPHMLRIDFISDDLHDFASASPDDHVKLFFPDAAAPKGAIMRDYTPRAFDTAKGTLTIDFALHDGGPATLWALGAKPGDKLEIGGPRGSAVVTDDFDYYLLVGDETALPSIGRRVETLRPDVPVTTLVIVDSQADVQSFTTHADWKPLWVFRSGQDADDATLLRRGLNDWRAPDGDGYVWIAAEARTARTLRDHFLDDRQHPKAWVKAAGYWVLGQDGASEKY